MGMLVKFCFFAPIIFLGPPLFNLMVQRWRKTVKQEIPQGLPNSTQILFAKFCGRNSVESDINLDCYCRKHPIFKSGCLTKIEILSMQPFMVLFHELLKNKWNRLRFLANNANFFKVRFGSEYGFNTKFYQTSENGVLDEDNDATIQVYETLGEELGVKKDCHKGKLPKSTVVRYKKGEFFNVHYDGFNLTLQNSLALKLMHNYRRFLGVLEMCRHRYATHNLWVCIYKLFAGSLQWTDYWNTRIFGPQMFSAMAQLSEVVGGETFFPHLGISVHTKPGDLFLWANVDDEWKRYDTSSHGGCPVLSENKLILVVFVPGMCNKIEDIKRIILQAR